MQNHRLAPTTSKPHKPVARRGTATRTGKSSAVWLLLMPLLFCGTVWVVMQWMQSASAPPVSVQPVATAQEIATAAPTQAVPSGVYADTATVKPPVGYNTDPWGTLAAVFATQGDAILLVGGSVMGGIILLLVAARYITRIPADPLSTGLGRTLTLLENDHRAGNLTPQRALEVARQVLAEQARAHDDATRTRTKEYEQAVARLSASHTEAIAAIRKEATLAVQAAQTQVSQADARTQAALQRVANTEVQVEQLSRDLATTHEQLVSAHATIRTQSAEHTDLTQTLEAVTDTLEEWQTAHHALVDRHTALSEDRNRLAQDLDTTQASLATATQQADVAIAAANTLRAEQTRVTGEKETLSAQLTTANKELSRLRGVSLRELAIVIPDREGDLVPYMAKLVEFIRGTTMDSGTAKGERTQKPILSSWRDIRRLFQVLKGVGVRLAVPAHHVPQWAGELVIVEKGEATSLTASAFSTETTDNSLPALTETVVSAHNGASPETLASQVDVSPLQHV